VIHLSDGQVRTVEDISEQVAAKSLSW
jgi:hypothetical protein